MKISCVEKMCAKIKNVCNNELNVSFISILFAFSNMACNKFQIAWFKIKDIHNLVIKCGQIDKMITIINDISG